MSWYQHQYALCQAARDKTLDTDACNMQIGSVLMYGQPNRTRELLSDWLKMMIAAKQKYDTTHQEYLALPRALLLLSKHLEGHKCPNCTDQDALKWMLNEVDGIATLERWQLRLLEFEFDVMHRAGIKSKAAIALSRLEAGAMDTTKLDEDSKKCRWC